jgi:hypothetical protein
MSIEIKKIPQKIGKEVTLPMHGLMGACGGIVKKIDGGGGSWRSGANEREDFLDRMAGWTR